MYTTSPRERGAVLPVVAISLIIVLLGAAFAVDVGRVALTAAEMRTGADLAALDAARDLNGQAASLQRVKIQNSAKASAVRNGVDPSILEVHLGVVSGHGADGRVNYRRLNMAVGADAATVPNAVEVLAKESVSFQFTEGAAAPVRSAVAMVEGDTTGTASIRIDTGVATVDSTESILLNTILGSLLGSQLQLNALRYGDIANVDVNLLGVLARLPVASGQVQDTLATTYSLSQFLGAMIDELAGTAAVPVLETIRLAGLGECLNNSGACIRPGDFLNGTVGGSPPDGITVSALELLRAAVMSGVRGRQLSVGIPVSVAPALTVDVALKVIAPPRIGIGGIGATASSAQLEATITPRVGGGLLNVPIFVGAGAGTASITSLECDGGAVPARIGVHGTTAAARLGLGRLVPDGDNNYLNNTVEHATVIDAITVGAIGGLVGVVLNLVGDLVAVLTNEPRSTTVLRLLARLDAQLLTTSFNFVETPALTGVPPVASYPGTVRTFGFGSTTPGTPGYSQGVRQSILGTPLKPGDVLVQFPSGMNGIQNLTNQIVGSFLPALLDIVRPVLDGLVSPVVVPLLQALGVQVGTADVSVFDATCGQRIPRLVLVR